MPNYGPEWISVKEFCELVDVNHQRVSKGIKTGIIKDSVKVIKAGKSNRYLIHKEKGVKEWNGNLDPSKKRDPEKQMETKALNGNGSAPELSHFQKAKAHKEFFSAKLAELNYQEKANKLIQADQVKNDAFRIARRVRDSMLAVGDRVASEVAIMNDPRAISIYIKEQIAIALKDLDSLNNVGKPK